MKQFLFILLTGIAYSLSGQCKIDYTKIATVCNPVAEDNFNTWSTTNVFQWRNSGLQTLEFDDCPWYEKNATINNKNYYKIDPGMAPVSGGQLHLKIARVNPAETSNHNCFGEPGPHTIQFKTGMVESGKKFRYGIYEVSCRMPEGSPNNWDTWPTVWLYGGNTEIDMFDGGGENPGRKALMGLIDWGKQKPSLTLQQPTWTGLQWSVLPTNYSLTNLPVYDEQAIYPQGTIVKYQDINFIPNWRAYQANQYITRKSSGVRGNNLPANLSSGFHKFTTAWLPNKVIFFFDEREVFTIDNTNVITYYSSNPSETWMNGLHILCNLQLFKGIIDANYTDTQLANISFDIDYVKVWELNNANMTNMNIDIVKSESEMMYHEIEPISHNNDTWQEDLVSNNVDSRYGSITVNEATPNEIFFRKLHSNGRFRIFRKDLNNSNPPVLVAYNYALDEATGEAVGEIQYKDGILYYVGGDRRIQYFARLDPVNAPDTWWHGWVDDNWNNSTYWQDVNFRADITGSGVFDVADNRDVYYKSETGQLCVFKFTNSADWYGLPLNITPKMVSSPIDKYNHVEGDLSVTTNGSNHKLAYRAKTGSNINKIYVGQRLITSNSAFPFLTFTTSSPTISTKAGSILQKSGEVYFISSTNYINRAATPSSDPATQIFTCSSSNCPAEKANSNLVSEGNGIHYTGADNRMQYIFPTNPALPMSLTNTGHWWMDDHWNTDYFTTFTNAPNASGTDNFSASTIQSNGKLLYARKHNQSAISGPTVSRLGYLIYENCHLLNPPSEEEVNFSKTLPTDPGYTNHPVLQPLTVEIPNIKIHPNPAQHHVNIDFDNSFTGKLSLYSINGVLQQEVSVVDIYSTDLETGQLPAGIYLLQVISNSGFKQVIKLSKID